MTEQRHHNRNPKKVMAQEQKKTSKNTNSRRRGSARGRNANGSNSRTPSRKINATRQATAPQQDAVLIAPPKYRKGSMRITPLGGLGEIGRNMNVIEYNGHLLLIDCGVLFPEEEQPGVDLILPDFSYIKNRLDKVDALVLTHGHEDHIGGVPYLLKLRPDIPLIGSKLTLAFVDAKCKEHHQNPTKVEVAGREKLKVGPFDLEFVNVTHSIPDAGRLCQDPGRLPDRHGRYQARPAAARPPHHRPRRIRQDRRKGRGPADDGLHQRRGARLRQARDLHRPGP